LDPDQNADPDPDPDTGTQRMQIRIQGPQNCGSGSETLKGGAGETTQDGLRLWMVQEQKEARQILSASE